MGKVSQLAECCTLTKESKSYMWINLIRRALASTCFSNAWLLFEFDFDHRDTNKYNCSSTQLDSSADKEIKTTESTDGRGGSNSLEETTRMALILGSINKGRMPGHQ